MVNNLEKKQIKDKEFNILETIVTIAIILVVVHTFLEDFAVIINWNNNAQTILVIIGFGFDLFFTIEFLTRLYLAIHEKKALQYFLYEKGWIDFLASVPLIMFNSGPLFIASILGKSVSAVFGGILNMLKLIKAIRIARILRLLRFLKIFKKIKYADSKMAQRHVAKVITIGITTLVFTLFVMGTLTETLDFSGAKLDKEQQKSSIIDIIRTNKKSDSGINLVLNAINELKVLNNILVIKIEGKTIYSRFPQKYYDTNFSFNDYDYALTDDMEFFFDLRNSNILQARTQAKDSMIFFFIVVMLVCAYLVIYSPHFALTVTDPIYVMRRGLEEPSYNLNVKIPEEYKEDDIYHLALLYNEIYLPLKDINLSREDAGSSQLNIEDYKDLLDS